MEQASCAGSVAGAGTIAGMTIRVFLLDDHALVREGIRLLLESESDIEVVGEAGTAAEAMTRVPLASPAALPSVCPTERVPHRA